MVSWQSVSLSNIVGRYIAERRRFPGLAQDELADRLQIAAAALSRIESGRTAPKFTRIRDIADALGYTVADLFQEKPIQPAAMLASTGDLMKPLPGDAQADLIRIFTELARTMEKNCTYSKKG